MWRMRSRGPHDQPRSDQGCDDGEREPQEPSSSLPSPRLSDDAVVDRRLSRGRGRGVRLPVARDRGYRREELVALIEGIR
jgi:hypothetical protein